MLRHVILGIVLLAQAWFAHADSQPPMLAGQNRLEKFRSHAALQGWEESRIADERDEVVLRFWLKATHASRLEHTLEQVSDPYSSQYGHYLSPKEVDKLVAPNPEHLLTVKEALRGLQLEESTEGSLISATMTVERATSIVGGTFRYFCREATPSVCVFRNPTAEVPAALSAACDAITPLDDPLPPATPGPIVASNATEAAVAASPTGCCFSVGLGSLMKPCCLRTRLVDHESSCKTEQRQGGGSGFHAGPCPETALQAADLIQQKKNPQLQLENNAFGCCYAIGYGALMRPCCLRTEIANNVSMCRATQRLGGDAGYSAHGCPTSAMEAAAWLGSEAPEVTLGKHSARLNDGLATMMGFLLAIILCVLVSSMLVHGRRRSAQDANGNLRAYESSRDMDDEARIPLRPKE